MFEEALHNKRIRTGEVSSYIILMVIPPCILIVIAASVSFWYIVGTILWPHFFFYILAKRVAKLNDVQDRNVVLSTIGGQEIISIDSIEVIDRVVRFTASSFGQFRLYYCYKLIVKGNGPRLFRSYIFLDEPKYCYLELFKKNKVPIMGVLEPVIPMSYYRSE